MTYAIPGKAQRSKRSQPTLPMSISVGMGLALIGLPLMAGASVSEFGELGLIGTMGFAAVAVIVRQPVFGPYLLLASTPILVGLERGAVVPFLRLNEAVLVLVAGALLLNAGIRSAAGDRRPLLACGIVSADWAVGFFVLAGSPVPLLVRFGRGLDLSVEDITHAFVFAKIGLLYLVFRYAVVSREQIRRCLIISLAISVPVALAALAQSLNLPGAQTALAPWLQQTNTPGRGSGTIGSPIAFADVMAVHLAIGATLLFEVSRRPRSDQPSRAAFAALLGATGLYAVSGVGSGQFTGIAATLIVLVVVSVLTKRPQALLAIPLAASVAGIALWPVLSRRFEAFASGPGIPPSWQGRINNLNTFFLPPLRRDFNWLFGVRPDTDVDNPRVVQGQTFIESGVLWLLWAGGILLLIAAIVLLVVAYRRFLAAARDGDLWLRTVGIAGAATTTFIMALGFIDPHLTIRGLSDVYYPMIAISLLAIGKSGDNAPSQPDAVRSPTLAAAVFPAIGYPRYSGVGLFMKRTLDIIVSLSLLILLLPLLVAIVVTIRLTSPGPALFRQSRIGFCERPFTILKFRTMAVDNDESEHRDFVQAMLREQATAQERSDDPGEPSPYKLVDDPRITSVGHWLRRSSLDELPQLINVLRGQMSLVGPRPCIAYEVSEFSADDRLRATSVPGMTGLWQVQGRSDLHMRDALELDLQYVRSCSLWLDLKILAKTVLVVLRGSGA